MFCTYCNCNVSKDTTVCPNCGNQLDATTRTLNPKPQSIIEEGTPLLGEVITDATLVQETVIGQSTVVSDEDVVNITKDNEDTTVQLSESDVPSVNTEATSNQSKIYDFSSSVMQIPNTEIDTQVTDVKSVDTTPAEKIVKRKAPVALFVILLLAVLAVIIFIIFNKKPSQDKNDISKITETTEVIDMTATAQDAIETTTESLNDLNTEAVSEPVQSITFGETTVEPITIESVQVTDTETIITKSTYEITAEEARTYIDEQEVLYQLEDSSIQDVAYVKSAYRYHYVGYYQYGVYNEDVLLVFTITDDVAVDSADNFAWEYFTEMGVE